MTTSPRGSLGRSQPWSLELHIAGGPTLIGPKACRIPNKSALSVKTRALSFKIRNIYSTTPSTQEYGLRFGILDGDRGLMVVLPSSTLSYNCGAPLDNVPREGQAGVGVCHYFQLRLVPLLFVALIQRPAELALSFPRHAPTMIKDNACLPSPNPPPFPLVL